MVKKRLFFLWFFFILFVIICIGFGIYYVRTKTEKNTLISHKEEKVLIESRENNVLFISDKLEENIRIKTIEEETKKIIEKEEIYSNNISFWNIWTTFYDYDFDGNHDFNKRYIVKGSFVYNNESIDIQVEWIKIKKDLYQLEKMSIPDIYTPNLYVKKLCFIEKISFIGWMCIWGGLSIFFTILAMAIYGSDAEKSFLGYLAGFFGCILFCHLIVAIIIAIYPCPISVKKDISMIIIYLSLIILGSFIIISAITYGLCNIIKENEVKEMDQVKIDGECIGKNFYTNYPENYEFYENGLISFIGEIENNSNKNYTYVDFNVSIFDINNKLLGVDTIIIMNFMSKQKRSYKVSMWIDPKEIRNVGRIKIIYHFSD